MENNSLNAVGGLSGAGAGASAGASASASSGLSSGASQAISVALEFGVAYLYSKQENKKNQELIKRMAELDAKQAEKLKKAISEADSEVAKTKVIIDFLNTEKIKQLEQETKKERILPLVGLGLGIIIIAIIFYKLNKQNG